MTVNRERYTPHDVGPSPLDWEAPYLSEVSSLITNGFVGTATPYYTDETGVPYLYGTNVRANKLDPKGIRFVTEEFNEKQSKTRLETGDLLTVQSGHIGETAVVTEEFAGANCHALIVTRPKKEHVFSPYLGYYINSEIGKARLKGLEVGSTILHINTKDLKKFRVLLPPLPEQRKITKILSTWDKAISTTEKLIETSKQQKKALMQQLLTGKKRLINPETGKAFEGEWEEVKLGNLTTKITKGTTPSTNGFQFHENGINFVKVESILKSGQFDLSKFAYIDEECHLAFKRSQLEDGDILFSIAGALGRTAIVTDAILPANTNQALSIVRLKKNVVCSGFILQYLNCTAIAAMIKGLTAQAAQPNLSLKDVGNLLIRLPSGEEQKKIASVLTAADKETEVLQAKLAHFKQEKKALMQQLLTGKRRVKVDEVA